MTITASCGHKVEHLSHLWNYSVADHDKLGNRAVSYMALCKQCYDEYEKDGLILHDEGEENKWLGANELQPSPVEVKIKEALEWVEFVLEHPEEIRSLRNARDLLKTLLENNK